MEHEPSSSVRVTRGHRKSFGKLQWTAGFAVYHGMATTTNEIESCLLLVSLATTVEDGICDGSMEESALGRL